MPRSLSRKSMRRPNPATAAGIFDDTGLIETAA